MSRDEIAILIFLSIVGIAIIATLLFQHNECLSEGGAFVRALFWFKCLN